MWISTVTMDMVAIRAMTEQEIGPIMMSILEKKNQLRSDPANGGESLDGFKARDSLNEIGPSESVVVVKREWNNQSVAQEFVDYVNTAHSSITATLEEQV
jgi:hypothetical protein